MHPERALVPRIGIGGPVGSGKTALVAALCRTLAGTTAIGVVTNDIYTTEDADFLRRAGVLPDERIRAVQTGACPHTAIRDDISANLDAVEALEADHPGLELILVESGGDNLTATFSYGLVHRQIFDRPRAAGRRGPVGDGAGRGRGPRRAAGAVHLAGHRPGCGRGGGVGAGRGSGVIARTTAVVEAGGVLGELACAPPLTLRQVHGAAGRCELRLVGTAAGPLPGDDLALSLRLRPGARATLRAVAASLAQGGASSLSMRADLAEGADLVADPGALIVCAGSRVDVRLETARPGHPALGRDPVRPARAASGRRRRPGWSPGAGQRADQRSGWFGPDRGVFRYRRGAAGGPAHPSGQRAR